MHGSDSNIAILRRDSTDDSLIRNLFRFSHFHAVSVALRLRLEFDDSFDSYLAQVRSISPLIIVENDVATDRRQGYFRQRESIGNGYRTSRT
jgi:hypothetical protein